ncbi:hypothetical protein GWI33_005181 [Rhynchophorus ferrugineus]|uniref:RING-type domain-containing protein n=1 Tax=Rhynchophorus ferrugineus TaxID=354439 RepID=A0A834MI76_RHYFE|nr:hypothetical protein GWI33_005181 [Rhynchophorus ferrugineus]
MPSFLPIPIWISFGQFVIRGPTSIDLDCLLPQMNALWAIESQYYHQWMNSWHFMPFIPLNASTFPNQNTPDLPSLQMEDIPPPLPTQLSVTRNRTEVHMCQSGPSTVWPTVPQVKRTQKDKKFPRGQKTCTVCLAKFRREHCVRQLRCQHRFHDNCIKEWLNQHTICPVCRSDVHSPRDVEIFG